MGIYVFPIKKATPPLEATLAKQNPVTTSAVNVSTRDTCITLAGTLKQ